MSDKSTSAILKKPAPTFFPFYSRQYSGNNNSPWFTGSFYNTTYFGSTKSRQKQPIITHIFMTCTDGKKSILPLQEKMSSTNDEYLHTAHFLTWRKIQLSRAKLKASSKTSALLSGFAMVAMVELQLDEDTPKNLLIVFTVCTTLLVSVHLLALMISTCILPHIETICSSDSKSTTLLQESPHERLHWYIEIAWFFSTLLGLLLFLCEVAIICWVKFFELSRPAAWTTSIIMIPVMIIFVAFAVHFYHTLVMHKYEVTVSGIRELELLKEQIEASDPEARSDKAGVYGGIQII